MNLGCGKYLAFKANLLHLLDQVSQEASSECGTLHAVAHLDYKMLDDRVCLIVHLITHAIYQNGFHTVTKCLLIDLAVLIIFFIFFLSNLKQILFLLEISCC